MTLLDRVLLRVCYCLGDGPEWTSIWMARPAFRMRWNGEKRSTLYAVAVTALEFLGEIPRAIATPFLLLGIRIQLRGQR